MGENPIGVTIDQLLTIFPAMIALYGNYNGEDHNDDMAFNIELCPLVWGSGWDLDARLIGIKIPNTPFLVPPAASGQFPTVNTIEDVILSMETQGFFGDSKLSKYRVSEEEYYEGCYSTLLGV